MRTVGMLAKYWQPGEAKTRLANGVGADKAARLYRLFVQLLLVRLAACGDRRLIAFAPRSRREAFHRLITDSLGQESWELTPQGTGDLGQRMEACFRRTLLPGHRVVLIGSDSPTLTQDLLDEAFRQLEELPVVLGPTLDGGYYLVGARGEVPPIFDAMDWSTDSVFEATAQRLDRAGIPFGTLPRWYDVDTRDDLPRLARDLADQIGLHAISGGGGCTGELERKVAEDLLLAVRVVGHGGAQ
ncbi:MAG: TIGR04282 family arsenosugar biosynthesis glycosyltransferase [Pirellulales bacterium]